MSVDSNGEEQIPLVVSYIGYPARHDRETDYPKGNDTDEPVEEEVEVFEDMAIKPTMHLH